MAIAEAEDRAGPVKHKARLNPEAAEFISSSSSEPNPSSSFKFSPSHGEQPEAQNLNIVASIPRGSSGVLARAGLQTEHKEADQTVHKQTTSFELESVGVAVEDDVIPQGRLSSEEDRVREEPQEKKGERADRCLEDLWTIPPRLKENLQTISNACNDVLAWKSVMERALPKDNSNSWEEALDRVQKAICKQKEIVQELEAALHRAGA